MLPDPELIVDRRAAAEARAAHNRFLMNVAGWSLFLVAVAAVPVVLAWVYR